MINIQMNKYSMEYKVGLLKAYFVFFTILGIYFSQSWEFIFYNLGNLFSTILGIYFPQSWEFQLTYDVINGKIWL